MNSLYSVFPPPEPAGPPEEEEWTEEDELGEAMRDMTASEIQAIVLRRLGLPC